MARYKINKVRNSIKAWINFQAFIFGIYLEHNIEYNLQMKILQTFFLFLVFNLNAQDFPGWEGHFSYLNVSNLSKGNNKIVAAAENAYFNYEPELNFTKTFSTINRLSGNRITALHYSEEFKYTIVGYENGLIQIIRDQQSQVFNFVDIVNRVTIAPNQKNINHILEHEGFAYFSTDFGIVEFNLESREFGDTFFIGGNASAIQVNQTSVLNNRLYAATDNGLYIGNLSNPDLIDFNNWTQFNTNLYRTIASFNTKIYVTSFGNDLWEYNEGNNSLNFITSMNATVRDMRESANKLLVVTNQQVFSFDQNLNEDIPIFEIEGLTLDLNTAIVEDNIYYLADRNLGLIQVNNASGLPSANFLSPNGPLLNRVFRVTAGVNQLWVTYGEYDQFFNPFPLNTRGVSHLVEEIWSNILPEDLANAREIADATIDPLNPNRVILSSYIDGLLVLENEELVALYNSSNSNIEGVATASADDNRIGASTFTPDGNLYFSNSLSENPIKRLTTDGTIDVLDISNAFQNATSVSSAKITSDAQGNVYLATIRAGIMAYQPSTNTSGKISSDIAGVDFPEVLNPNPLISALAVDTSNRLWIGTQDGLRVMFNPSSVFSNSPLNVSPIIIVEEDGVAQELLFEQFITDIAVDGANNKWIGTADSGVFQVSPNGQDVLNQFTTANSPLPSNSISSISIDGSNGKVYFGTVNGLVSFNSRITDAQQDLTNVRVFPNPVRPSYTGEVTIDGLTEGANVKITDITGNLVYEEVARGGSIRWDTSAFGKYKVASGVYLVLITGSDEIETEVKKIMIVR